MRAHGTNESFAHWLKVERLPGASHAPAREAFCQLHEPIGLAEDMHGSSCVAHFGSDNDSTDADQWRDKTVGAT